MGIPFLHIQDRSHGGTDCGRRCLVSRYTVYVGSSHQLKTPADGPVNRGQMWVVLLKWSTLLEYVVENEVQLPGALVRAIVE